eukprot:scaffold289843_cov22-Prasinocladus_malaysianus.AAC.1
MYPPDSGRILEVGLLHDDNNDEMMPRASVCMVRSIIVVACMPLIGFVFALIEFLDQAAV